MKTQEELENCEGYETSTCCGAKLYGDICRECKEHTDNQCVDCEHNQECDNYKSMEEL